MCHLPCQISVKAMEHTDTLLLFYIFLQLILVFILLVIFSILLVFLTSLPFVSK